MKCLQPYLDCELLEISLHSCITSITLLLVGAQPTITELNFNIRSPFLCIEWGNYCVADLLAFGFVHLKKSDGKVCN